MNYVLCQKASDVADGIGTWGLHSSDNLDPVTCNRGNERKIELQRHWERIEGHGLKCFASLSITSRGRQTFEPPPRDRTEFQRDCDRIVHTTAFRRLMHKTQVYIAPESDHVRTRLTHTIEVARAARALSHRLGLNADLAEAIALAHDLGHPPFGHAGENVLQDLMEDFGGFEHNAQSLRIVNKLVHTYMDFDGLNLTWECLEGIAKHGGPPKQANDHQRQEFGRIRNLMPELHGSGEAQVAAIADDVAYNCHDMQDGLRIGQFKMKELSELSLIGVIHEKARQRYPEANDHKIMHLVVRESFGRLIADIANESERRLQQLAPDSADQLRQCRSGIVGFSSAMEQQLEEIRNFLDTRMYNVPRMRRQRRIVVRFMEKIFSYYCKQPSKLPDHWTEELDHSDRLEVARTVADYIAGMTDNFALHTFARINGLDGMVTMRTVGYES